MVAKKSGWLELASTQKPVMRKIAPRDEKKVDPCTNILFSLSLILFSLSLTAYSLQLSHRLATDAAVEWCWSM